MSLHLRVAGNLVVSGRLRRYGGGHGEEGMAQIGERSFDVVRLDLALPDKSGMDLLGRFAVACRASGNDDYRLWHG